MRSRPWSCRRAHSFVVISVKSEDRAQARNKRPRRAFYYLDKCAIVVCSESDACSSCCACFTVGFTVRNDTFWQKYLVTGAGTYVGRGPGFSDREQLSVDDRRTRRYAHGDISSVHWHLLRTSLGIEKLRQLPCGPWNVHRGARSLPPAVRSVHWLAGHLARQFSLNWRANREATTHGYF
jgi:hypothetical protein